MLLSASLISGILSSFVSLPFDNAKVKMQKMKKNPDGTFPYKNIFDTMNKTIKVEGFTHLWVGFPTYYFRIAPHVCFTLVTQDHLTDFIKHLRGMKH
jgi:solute carrier family 25 oxoglutarate transporter 11